MDLCLRTPGVFVSSLVHKAKSPHLLIRHVCTIQIPGLICRVTFNPSLAVSLPILPDQISTKHETQDKRCTAADHHGEEARRVAWSLVGKEELRADNVACAVGNEDLRGSALSQRALDGQRTIAFAVFFFVKPPMLPLDMLRTIGKLAEKAMQRQYPMKRAQM